MAREMNVGQELLNVPMGEMIRSMALAIAESQWELDKASMTVTEMMSGQRLLRNLDTGELLDWKGNAVAPSKDANGHPLRDDNGELLFPSDAGPCVIDSRVYFGYVYQEERGADGKIVEVDGKPQMIRKPNKVSLLELGFSPSFYQFVDTVIEVKLTVSMSSSETQETRKQQNNRSSWDHSYSRKSSGGSAGWWRNRGGGYSWGSGRSSSDYGWKHSVANVSAVDGRYSSTYNYSVEGSSYLRTKMVPVPPPAVLQDRVRQLMEFEQEYQDRISAGTIHKVKTVDA